MRAWWLVALTFVLAQSCGGRSNQTGVGSGGLAARGGAGGKGASPGTGGGGTDAGTAGNGAKGGAGGAGGAAGGSVGGSFAGSGAASGSGGAAAGAGPLGGGGTGGGAAGEAGASGSDCLIAIRTDECCSEARPVSRSEFEADGCFLELSPQGVTIPRQSDCEPIPCPAVVCGTKLRSHLVGRDNSGSCAFVSECDGPDDCTLADNTEVCCPCPDSLPQKLVNESACLQPLGGTVKTRCHECGDVNCDECPESPAIACLVSEPGLNRCGFAAPTDDIPAGRCSEERLCSVDNAPGIRCFAPDEAYCAGPPPPPDECATDEDCDSSSLPFVCEASGHCGQKQCVNGCASSDECGSSQTCDATHRCVARDCIPAAGCGPNFDCVDAKCTRGLCLRSADTCDYCVNGRCYDTPGQCLDAEAP